MDTKTRIAELLSRAEDAASHVDALIDALRAAEDMRDDGECIDSVRGAVSDAEDELSYLVGACSDLREAFEEE